MAETLCHNFVSLGSKKPGYEYLQKFLENDEQRLFVVSSANNQVIIFTKPFWLLKDKAILAAEIDVLAIDPPFYARHGDIFLYVLVIISLLFLFIKNRHRFGNKRSRAGVTPARPEVVDQSG